MLNVKDEILSNKPVYRIKDEEGNIIEENAEIDLMTPLVEEGTPINKLLFDKVNSEILIDGKYNEVVLETDGEQEHFCFKLEASINEYDANRKISILIPSNIEYDTNEVYLRIGTLPYKKVNNFGNPGDKLTLIYNEETDSFDIDKGIATYTKQISEGAEDAQSSRSIRLSSLRISPSSTLGYIKMNFDGTFDANRKGKTTNNTNSLIIYSKYITTKFSLNENGLNMLENNRFTLLESISRMGGSGDTYGITLDIEFSWDNGELVLTPIIDIKYKNYLFDWEVRGTLSVLSFD